MMIDIILTWFIPIWAISVTFNGIAIYCIFRHYEVNWTGSSTTFWTTITLFPIWNTIFALMFLMILIFKEAGRSLKFIQLVFSHDKVDNEELTNKLIKLFKIKD